MCLQHHGSKGFAHICRSHPTRVCCCSYANGPKQTFSAGDLAKVHGEFKELTFEFCIFSPAVQYINFAKFILVAYLVPKAHVVQKPQMVGNVYAVIGI